MKNRLNLKRIDDYEKLIACRYLIEDTEHSVLDYRKFGLGNLSGLRVGEAYIRLYGLLNSVYQQIYAIVELIEIFHFPNKKKIIKAFRDLSIYKIRNKIGSHSINYKLTNNVETIIDFHKVGQSTLKGWGRDIQIMSNKSGSEYIDLLKSLEEYERYSNNVL